MVNYFPPEPLFLPFYPFLLKKKKKKAQNRTFLITNKVCNRSVSGNSNFCCFLTELRVSFITRTQTRDLPGGPLPIKGMWIQPLLGNQDSTCYVVWPKDFLKKEKKSYRNLSSPFIHFVLQINFYSLFTDNQFFP